MTIHFKRIHAGFCKRRKREKLSLRDLQGLTGVSYSTLRRYEIRGKATLETQLRIAEWLEFNLDVKAIITDNKNIIDKICKVIATDKNLSDTAKVNLENWFTDTYKMFVSQQQV